VSLPIRAPSNAGLLDAWDRGRGEHPLDRALTLLAAFTGARRRSVAELTIGARDELLLTIRRRFFGERLEALCACERCGEVNEFAIDARELPARPERPETTLLVRTGSAEVAARLPNSLDLAAVLELGDAEALAALAARCLPATAVLDEPARDALETAMAQAETLAALDITFACSVCGESNAVPFEAEIFLWDDVASAARRLLRDVDVLASTYGWSEAAILALRAERRATYVSLATR